MHDIFGLKADVFNVFGTQPDKVLVRDLTVEVELTSAFKDRQCLSIDAPMTMPQVPAGKDLGS